jgi:hypothetical protein
MYDAPSYVWALVLIGTIGIPLTTAIMLYRGALAARMRKRTAAVLGIVAAYLLGAWLVVSAVLAGTGVYAEETGDTAAWFGVAFTGVLVALLLSTAIPVVSRALSSPGSLVRLTIPHSLRLVGVVFLIAMAQGGVPWVFALPAGLGDIATGAAAPFVARRLARGEGHRRAVWFNVFGLLDLAVALTIGFLFGLGPWMPFEITPTTEALAFLPLALVPTVAVPVAITLHIVSLRQLRAAARENDGRRLISIAAREEMTVRHG